MPEQRGEEVSGTSVAIHPEAAGELAAALQRAGQDADDLLARVRRALAQGGGSAPVAIQALDDAGAWGSEAAADLRWRIDAMLALDRTYPASGEMVAGTLPFASLRDRERAVRQAMDRLDRVLAGATLRGDAGARAEAVRSWAAGLAPGSLDAVAEQAPGLVGNLDGVPPAVRYGINRRRVEVELARVGAQLAGPLDPQRRAGLTERQAALTLLAAPGPDGRDRQLLAFDPAGDGIAVQVFGELTSADHVVVLVPGMGSDLENAGRLADDALRLQLRAGRMAPSGQQVAAVAWLGYDAPDGGLQAAQTDAAREGAPQLVDFFAGQGLAGDVHTTVVGHSYGSVVTGHALAAGLGVGDAVVIGSPGVGQGVTADDLRPEGGELYAMRAADDLIRYVDGHGGDPVNADFGAVVLTANQPGYEPIAGHSAYYTPESLSLDNLAAVTVDRPDLLIVPAEPLRNPVSVGPFLELPTTIGDRVREGLGGVIGRPAPSPDEQAR